MKDYVKTTKTRVQATPAKLKNGIIYLSGEPYPKNMAPMIDGYKVVFESGTVFIAKDEFERDYELACSDEEVNTSIVKLEEYTMTKRDKAGRPLVTLVISKEMFDTAYLALTEQFNPKTGMDLLSLSKSYLTNSVIEGKSELEILDKKKLKILLNELAENKEEMIRAFTIASHSNTYYFTKKVKFTELINNLTLLGEKNSEGDEN